jgi:hypothetical protein
MPLLNTSSATSSAISTASSISESSIVDELGDIAYRLTLATVVYLGE